MVVKKKRMINGRSYRSNYKIRRNAAFFNTAFVRQGERFLKFNEPILTSSIFLDIASMMTRSTNTQGTAARLSAFTGMALIFGALALMSHHNGVAEEQNKDRTGAPGSQQPCSACHNSGSYDVTPSI
jgi:hypothetical protein